VWFAGFAESRSDRSTSHRQTTTIDECSRCWPFWGADMCQTERRHETRGHPAICPSIHPIACEGFYSYAQRVKTTYPSNRSISPRDTPGRRLNGGQLIAILLCVLVAAIDHSIIAVALPVLGKDLRVTESGLQWIAGSYTIAFAGGLFVAGRLGDRFGRKLLLLAGLLVFIAASMYAATADGTLQLALGRGFMGVGGTLLLPSTLAIVTTQAAEGKRALAISLWSATFGVGVALGPLLGGALLNYFSWHSIFWVNVPILATAVLLVSTTLATDHPETKPAIHLLDGLLSAASIGAIVAAIIEAPNWGLFSTGTVLFGVSGLLGIVFFVYRQLRISDPLLDMRMFRNRPVSVAAFMITLLFMSFSGALFLLTQFAELVAQFSAFQTGLMFIPLSGGIILGSLWAAAIGSHRSAKTILIIGATIGGIGTGLLAMMMNVDLSPWAISGFMAISTFGLGAAFAAATVTITGALPKRQAGITSALNDITRELGGALGVATIGSLASWRYAGSIVNTLSAYRGTPAYTMATGGLEIVRAGYGKPLPAAVITQSMRAFAAGTQLALVVSAISMIVLALFIGVHLPVVHVGHDREPEIGKRWFAH
jgi:DHA2 family multidrug resistance protein-like MFS transporter